MAEPPAVKATTAPAAAKPFSPFASGEADQVKAGAALPAGTDPSAHWATLYGGLDDIDKRVDPTQRAAFAAMDKVVKDPKEARARAVNQSYVADAYGLEGSWVTNNWDAVKVALADHEFGDKSESIEERWLYGKIAERLGASGKEEQFGEKAEIKPWTWKDSLRSNLHTLVHGRYNSYYGRQGPSISSFWESINRPIRELPEPPENLPDVWIPGPGGLTNPAVAAGLYKGALKPLVESLESPFGLGTLGTGVSLKEAASTVPAAKAALGGMSGAFAALMGYATVEAAPEAIRVAMSPTSTTQQKVEALSGTVGTAALAVVGAIGAAFELLPDKGAKLGKSMEGKTPSQSAEMLRQEAMTSSPEVANALNRAATTLDEVGAYERGPDEWDVKPPQTERISAAAVQLPDGSVVEGANHEAIKAEISVSDAEPAKVNEGFVTSSGRFVGRTEAADIAANAGQLKEDPAAPAPKPGETTSPKELQSHQVEMDPTPEFPRSGFGQTSLKNAYGELERVAYGFDEVVPSERRAMAERWERSREVLEKNPEAGRLLAEKLLNNPNIGLTDDQSALLLRHKVGLQNALNEAADIAADPKTSEPLRAEAQAQVKDLSDQLVNLLDAVNKRGSEWGREGRWRQALAREDYSFAAQETLLRASKGGSELTESEREGLQNRVKELEAAQARYDAKIAELQAIPREAAVEATVRDMSKPPPSPRRFKTAESVGAKIREKAIEARKRITDRLKQGTTYSGINPADLIDSAIVGADAIYSTGLDFAEWSARMAADLGERIKPHLAEIWDASVKLFHSENAAAMVEELKSLTAEERSKKLGPFAQELARAKIEAGTKGRDAIVDAVWSDLKEAIPAITRSEAADAISGYGKFKPLTHDEITDQLRDLKGQLQQVAKLEDMEAGRAPKKTGVERRTPSDEERNLQKKVEAKKKEGGYVVTDPERQLRTALQAVKRNLDNRIKDLVREFETGEKPSKGKPAPTDAQTELLKSFRDRVAKTIEQVEGTAEMTPEERIKRSIDSTSAAINRLEEDLQKGNIFPEGGPASEAWSPELGKLKSQLDDLRSFRKEMQKFAKPPKTPEERALATVKGNLKRQIESIEKQIESRTRVAKAKKSVALDAEAEGMKARRDELRAEFEQIFGRKELTDEQRLNIWKVAARKRLADLQERLANKDFEPKERRSLPLDDEAAKIKGQIERIRQDFWIERNRAEEAGRPVWQKALTTSADLARAGAISGYHTLGKLAMFSLARFSEAPIYEAAGALLRKIPGVESIAAKANFEAGSEYSGLARFYRKAATAGMRDALETLQTGKSGLKAELGDQRHNAQPVHWYDYFGILHMAEKSPLLRAEFELRLEKSAQWAIANGLDVENPMVSGALRKDAFEYAQRAILMENNALSTAINSFTRQLEAANPKTGKVDVTKATLSWFVKTFMTKGIVKTPANYVAQTFARSPLGLAKGTAELVVSHIQGVEKLTPEEANTIMRLLKVGAVGSAVFVWGAIDASKDPKDRMFGGYYQPGEKRGEDDVGFGKLRVGGIEFPHILTHNPLTESGQMGSTFYRVMKQKLKKNGKTTGEEKGALAGAATALVALASEAPIVSPIMREVQDVERGEAHKLVWDQVAGLVPMFVQNLAVDLDDNKSRRPETFEQAIENTLPGMRDNVPETKTQRERDIRQRLKK